MHTAIPQPDDFGFDYTDHPAWLRMRRLAPIADLSSGTDSPADDRSDRSEASDAE